MGPAEKVPLNLFEVGVACRGFPSALGAGLEVPQGAEVILAQGKQSEAVGRMVGLAFRFAQPAIDLESLTMALRNSARDHGPKPRATAWGLTTLVMALQASAQSGDPSQVVTVTAKPLPSASSLAGFADTPPWRVPFATGSVSQDLLKDLGATTPADLTRWDAAVSDAYNSPGYWSQFSVRGFVLDPRFNLRRDGLPVNGETALGLENIQALQVLKGTSGMQAGTSTPGGLVNLVVKRPQGRLRSFELGWRESGGLSAHLDLGDGDGGFGWRVNAASEHLAPPIRSASGHRELLAWAGDWNLGKAGRLEMEAEVSRQSQPSVPGFSLLGDRLPDPAKLAPRINLNNQPWSLPVVSAGGTASLRWTMALDPSWTAQAQALTQHLRTDDRVAFPFGCSASGQFDRYCADGSLDVYDYRSENERRRTDSADLSLRWRSPDHEATIGLLLYRYIARYQRQAFNFVGVGQVDGSLIAPPDPSLAFNNTPRNERSLEGYLRGRASLNQHTDLWLGLRCTHLRRASELTDGAERTSYRQTLCTPWLALSHQWSPRLVTYASWGQGIESQVVPNQPAVFDNAGRPLPALKSQQGELGLRWRDGGMEAAATAFDIQRPVTSDINGERVIDGLARHRGIEVTLDGRAAPWTWHAGAMALQARREGSSQAALNGLRPTNVPAQSMRLHAGRDMASWPSLHLHASAIHEGRRAALPGNETFIPGWTRLDVGARWFSTLGIARATWRAGVDNLTDRRAWRESPYQFGHVYLFPLPARAIRLSSQIDF